MAAEEKGEHFSREQRLFSDDIEKEVYLKIA